jgi:hypothetical protein
MIESFEGRILRWPLSPRWTKPRPHRWLPSPATGGSPSNDSQTRQWCVLTGSRPPVFPTQEVEIPPQCQRQGVETPPPFVKIQPTPGVPQRASCRARGFYRASCHKRGCSRQLGLSLGNGTLQACRLGACSGTLGNLAGSLTARHSVQALLLQQQVHPGCHLTSIMSQTRLLGVEGPRI